MRVFLAVLLALALFIPLPAMAVDQADLVNKIEELSKELDRLKQQMQELQKTDDMRRELLANVRGPGRLALHQREAQQVGGDVFFRAPLELRGLPQPASQLAARVEQARRKAHRAACTA